MSHWSTLSFHFLAKIDAPTTNSCAALTSSTSGSVANKAFHFVSTSASNCCNGMYSAYTLGRNCRSVVFVTLLFSSMASSLSSSAWISANLANCSIGSKMAHVFACMCLSLVRNSSTKLTLLVQQSNPVCDQIKESRGAARVAPFPLT